MRAYYFTNMYLSSIQQGIQPLHVTSRLFTKYMEMNDDCAWIDNPMLRQIYDWATNHETVICLNGGYTESIRELMNNFFNVPENPYPWAFFNEGKDALDGALTSIGIILPERIYETAQEKRENRADWAYGDKGWFLMYGGRYGDVCVYGKYQDLTEWEKDFIDEMSKYGLAK